MAGGGAGRLEAAASVIAAGRFLYWLNLHPSFLKLGRYCFNLLMKKNKKQWQNNSKTASFWMIKSWWATGNRWKKSTLKIQRDRGQKFVSRLIIKFVMWDIFLPRRISYSRHGRWNFCWGQIDQPNWQAIVAWPEVHRATIRVHALLMVRSGTEERDKDDVVGFVVSADALTVFIIAADGIDQCLGVGKILPLSNFALLTASCDDGFEKPIQLRIRRSGWSCFTGNTRQHRRNYLSVKKCWK